MRLTYIQKRIGAGILVLVALFVLVNYLKHWEIFGGLDKQVLIAVYVLVFPYWLFIGPSMQEMYDHRAGKGPRGSEAPISDLPGYSPKLWRYLLPLMAVAIAVVFMGDGYGLITGRAVPAEHWINVAFLEFLLVVLGILGWHRLKRESGGQ